MTGASQAPASLEPQRAAPSRETSGTGGPTGAQEHTGAFGEAKPDLNAHSEEGAMAVLDVRGQAGLALGQRRGRGVRFEGVAVGTGVYTAQGGQRIRITTDRLPLLAQRLLNVQIRDLHEEAVGATVGIVRGAAVVDDDVTFLGEVAIEPHATIIRTFPETIAFSIGLRFAPDELDPGPDGTALLPREFLVDHLALVAEGQDPDARLTKLLNEARQGLAQDGRTVDNDTATELRRQRDQALEAEKRARTDVAKAESRLENTNEKLELAEQAQQEAEARAQQADTETEAARLDLQRAKAGFATTILKLELQAGKDVHLHERQEELLAMDLASLDDLRLELAEEAVARQQAAAQDPAPATRAGKPEDGAGAGQVDPAAMDLQALSMRDSLRLGLVKKVL